MMSIDPTDEDESGDEGQGRPPRIAHSPGTNKSPSQVMDTGEGPSRNGLEGDQSHNSSTSRLSVSVF